MVLPNSHRLVYPAVLGNNVGRAYTLSSTGLLPSMVVLSRLIRLECKFVTLRSARAPTRRCPTTPTVQRARLSRTVGLGCSLFARRYWGNRCCFLFLGLLRWFTSPSSPPCPMYSDTDDRGLLCPVARFGDLRV